ncbi:MAG: hypothetical protein HYT94_02655 [Parcubacteria group bacterium]|nr:hypothetical protein [Parcubacteria group bacterium]
MTKTALLIGTSHTIREYAKPVADNGVHVETRENFDQALADIGTINPDIIGIILPNYFEAVTRFVKNVRALSSYKTIPMVYVGGMIEGADDAILRRYGVKTLTLGPVQTSEIARFILHQLSL